MNRKFIRQESIRHSKIGKNRKKIQKWRRPKGRHSKMRLKRKSYPISPSVGYKTSRKTRGKIKNKNPVLVENSKSLENLGKENILIFSGTLGARKKMELIKRAGELGLEIQNISKIAKKQGASK